MSSVLKRAVISSDRHRGAFGVVPFICRMMPFIGNATTSIRPFVEKNVPSVWIRGFTVVEVLIAITIIASLVAIAVPTLREFMANQRLATQANELIADLNYARSEAVRRGINVGVCITNDGTTCTGGGSWESGRLIFVDANNNTSWDNGIDQVIRVHAGLTAGGTLRAIAGAADPLFFGSRGTLTVMAQVSFALCDPRPAGKGRLVIVTPVGQARVDPGAPPACV